MIDANTKDQAAPPKPEDTVVAFISCINRHDVTGLTGMMTDDHIFIDSLGTIVRGREEMRKAWIGYFYLIPDYTIRANQLFRKEDTVVVVGTARGTYAVGGKLLERNKWEIPIAIRAIVQQGRLAGWQVYADNEPVRQLMAGQGEEKPGR